MQNLKDKLFFILDAVIVRPYVRYFPSPIGKLTLWTKIIQPYIVWRPRDLRILTVDKNEMEIRLPDLIQSYIYYFGMWEPNLTDYIRKHLRPGDCLIDVGANVGYFSLLGAKYVGESGKIYAIEASPSIYAYLEKNIEFNGYKNIIHRNIAASNERSTIEIFSAAQSGNLGATTTLSTKAQSRKYQSEGLVKTATLDEIVPRDDLLNSRIVKIDVEGAETQVVLGILGLLKEFSDDTEFIIELTREAVEASNQSIEGIVDIFRQNGFNAYHMRNDYSVAAYVNRFSNNYLTPLTCVDFKQEDIIFSKRQFLTG